MAEYIFELNEALYNEETGEACFKPTIKGELVRCKDCKYLGFKDFYGICEGDYCGIVRPWDYCSRGERRTE